MVCSTATIYRDRQKQFGLVSRGARQGLGAGVEITYGDDTDSRAELMELILYEAPSKRVYKLALVRLLIKVPKCLFYIKGEPNAAEKQHHFRMGRQVELRRRDMYGTRPTVDAKLVHRRDRHPIRRSILLQITSSVAGIHAVMDRSGDYMHYGYTNADVSSPCYHRLEEIQVIDPATSIKSHKCLVPDIGGVDSCGRRRFFWIPKLYK